MSSLASQIESLLFLATKPLKRRELLKVTGVKKKELEEVVNVLKERYSGEESGVRLIDHDNAIQIVSSPDNSELVEKMFQSEMTGELTKPALETLTIIAYRGPISKPELELIRGINCSLIIRNLSMRGLIQEHEEKGELMTTYAIHPEFLQYLGLTSIKELPNYEELSGHELLEELLKQRSEAVSET